MEDTTRQAIVEYVTENYKKLYYKKDTNKLIIEDQDKFYTVRYNTDESPLILSKGVV